MGWSAVREGWSAVRWEPVLKLAVGLFFTFTISFTVAGYQAILPVFVDAGAYENLCNGDDDDDPCDAQLERLNLMFSLAVSMINMSSLPVGVAIHYTGPLVMCCIGAFTVGIGAFLIGISTSTFSGWLLGYVTMAGGGTAIAYPMFTLPALFPHHKGMIFSLIMGAFDGSALMMLLFQLLHEWLGANTHQMYLSFLVLPLALYACAFWIFPWESRLCKRGENGTAEEEEGIVVIKDRAALSVDDGDMSLDDGVILKKESGVSGDEMPWMSESGMINIALSWPFVLVAAWLSVYVTAKYFYVENVNTQLKWITDNDKDKVDIGTKIFSLILPLSGIFFPFTSYMLDHHGSSASIFMMACISFISGAASIVKFYYLQYITMVSVVLNRYFLFATAPFLLCKMYGDLGPTIYGIGLFCAACLNLSNYGWSYMAVEENSWLYLFNPVFNGLCFLVGVALSFYVRKLERTHASRSL